MRFTSFLVSGALAAVAVAQSGTTTGSAPVATSAAEICLNKCPKGDVNCQAHCITVPSPNDQNAIDTTKCAEKCVQGNGTEAETKKYADCVQACISAHFYASQSGTPQATGGSGSGNNGGSGSGSGSSGADATATGTGASPTASGTGSGSGSGSGSQTTGTETSTGTQTGTGAAATKTGAAAGLTVGSSGAFIGAVAALLAL